MNGKQEEKLQQLLKLKRSETPGKPYFDHFLAEFHRYQRAELLEEPSRWQVVGDYFSSLRSLFTARALSYSSSFAALLLLAVVGLNSSGLTGGGTSVMGSSLASSTEATEQALRQIEVQPVSLSSFDRDFNAPRFVTGERTLAYENTVAF